ncbi:transmembrane protein 252-like [Eucyclogobius newberryi]|uniref:transmembrane protein 252-like n=1 Tax=Eucyclogobius newberryi TaxID=166745 RepID=UPI003B5A4B9E
MKLRKQLWSLARLTLPALGFVLTTSGAYLASLQDPYHRPLSVVPAYIMVALGFASMISGVFWSVCHSLKSKMYQRGAPRPQTHIFTIDRSSTFPPSYEESQVNQHSCPLPLDPTLLGPFPQGPTSEVVLIMAPPLYSPNCSEAPDCRWSWEHPPLYSQVEPCPAT